MNYMTGRQLTSLFPALTFIHRVTLSLHPVTSTQDVVQPWVHTLQNMDISIIKPDKIDIGKAGGRRHVRDTACWVIGKSIAPFSYPFSSYQIVDQLS